MTVVAPVRLPLVAAVALLCALALPAQAASSAASSASDSVTTSSGSISASVNQSSRSSSGDKVAQGDYRILAMDAVADRPGMLRLQLQAVADATPAGALDLTLPEAAVRGAYLRNGLLVVVTPTDFGLQFANPLTGEPFFLALDDAWANDLKNTAVRL